MINTHRHASATSSKGDSHLVCFGLLAISIAQLYRSISPAVVVETTRFNELLQGKLMLIARGGALLARLYPLQGKVP